MSWNIHCTAKSKDGLKDHVRKTLLAHSTPGTVIHDERVSLADRLDDLIDLFEVKPGQMLELKTCGHLENGAGGFSCQLTTNGLVLVE